MTARFAVTAMMLLLACGAFLQVPHDPPRLAQDAGYLAFGILFVVIAGMTWFKWAIIRAGFDTAKDESRLPIIRLGSKSIAGLASLLRPRPRQRRSPSN